MKRSDDKIFLSLKTKKDNIFKIFGCSRRAEWNWKNKNICMRTEKVVDYQGKRHTHHYRSSWNSLEEPLLSHLWSNHTVLIWSLKLSSVKPDLYLYGDHLGTPDTVSQIAQSAGVIEYINCFSVERLDSPQWVSWLWH